MYRVAVIVNENETLHSIYADTISIIKKSLSIVYGNQVEKLYSFETIDKFNIQTLFENGTNNINTFDSIFIATNACNNSEIYDELVRHKSDIEKFIDDGNGLHHGICITNQQKLGDDLEKSKPILFLPEKLSYKLIKRKEKQSFDGKVELALQNDIIVNFPLKVKQSMIDECCSGENNQFMPHKYRHYIVPNYYSAYEVIYEDTSYMIKGNRDTKRCLLLKSRISNERIVISSVVLDWAEHLNQLANIIIFITEGINQIAYISKEKNESSFDFFKQILEKSNGQKIAIKEYYQNDINSLLENFKIHPHRVFIFSNEWSSSEIMELWNLKGDYSNNNVAFYHIKNSIENSKQNSLSYECLFSKSIKNSQMFSNSLEWIFSNFITKKWRKSIWTYEYITNLLRYIAYSRTSYIEVLYEEIINHYKIQNKYHKKRKGIDETELISPSLLEIDYQSYDNVFNSSCSCCNVLSNLYDICLKKNIESFPINNKKIPSSKLLEDRNRFGNWITFKLLDDNYKVRISWQDNIMAVVSLISSGYYDYIKNSKSSLFTQLENEIVKSEERLLFLLNKVTSINEISIFSNADLSKILKYISILQNVGYSLNDRLIEFVNQTIIYLYEIQKYNGIWKNLSETAELLLALLQIQNVVEESKNYKNVEFYRRIVNLAVNCIQNSYSLEQSCWLNDENTTAKALLIIAQYDKAFYSTIDDFLLDISNTTKRYRDEMNVENNIIALDYAQSECNRMFNENSKLNDSNNKVQKEINHIKKLITKYKLIVGTLVASVALTILFVAWILGILASKYNNILKEIFSDNLAVILSTILGLVATSILTGIFQYLKTKLVKSHDNGDEK